ncbi:16S rRNA (uracil(1498)-N(3))-methyltransferase [Burkholderia sp. SRS-W-2-2016]|uniref:16S rRNA (uracil(1498)-N(3))-methyltransferase n=1 Tax=Burkholderia sp. SRS-W-2-2016 TaxID=1926878 RepID=UPI00094B318A|nr:16S rRNA (uracil(1498)-N(3))-methyltransferase [Burkholderia sp. SRS-W-2-2016]OLL29868.1 16S rRNA (uracil(1498)-N(3))-methyltransferase [Burkholderia sp. SRS-W-2-2016]
MPRFFVAAPLYPDDVIALPDDVVRHVLVLRLQPGDSLVLFNGEGGEYDAELVEVERRSARVRIREFREVEVEPPYRLTLAQGIAGGDKMDWLIEKAVELGAAGFVPLATARSVVRLAGERAQRRQQHWQGVVRASCEQCGRNRLPEVQPVQEFDAWLDRSPREPAAGELRLLLSPRASIGFTALPETPPPGGVTLLIGPEGGLSADEEAAAVERGFTAVGLGPRVLRTETAGIAVLAALAARWGGW